MKNEKDSYDKREILKDRQALLVQRTNTVRYLRRLQLACREAEQERELLRAGEISNGENQENAKIEKLDRGKDSCKEEEDKIVKSRKVKTAAQNLSHSELVDIRNKLLEEKVRQEVNHTKLIRQHTEANSFDVEKRQEVNNRKRTFRADLQDQLIANCLARREKEEERHQERAIVEQAGQVVEKEIFNLAVQRRKKVAQLQADIAGFFKAKQIWMGRQGEIISRENECIAQTIAEKEKMQNKLTDTKTEIKKIREKVHEKFTRQIFDEERQKAERESIINELQLMKIEEKLADESLAFVNKKKRLIKEAQNELANRRREIEQYRATEKATDVAFAQYLESEKRKDMEKEKIRVEELRKKKAEYAKDLLEMINQRKLRSRSQGELSNICQSKPEIKTEEI